MSEFIHHPDNRNTGQTLDAKNPHKLKHTGKTLTAKTLPMVTQFPSLKAAHWLEIKSKIDASRQIATAIQACLQNDLPEYTIEIQVNIMNGHHDININPIDAGR